MAVISLRGPKSALRGLAIFFGLGFFLISSFGLAAGDVGGDPEKGEIVVAYPQPSGAFTPVWVAYEAGLFKKYGLTAKLQVLNPQVSVQAVISGSADVGTAAGDLINASLQGARIKLFASTTMQFVFQLWAAKEITEIQQLKGKTIGGSTPRSPVEVSTREVLKRYGLGADKDFKFLYLQTVPAILTAIVTGKAAAGALSAPTTLKAKEAGLNLLADYGKLNVPGPLLAYGATEKFLKDNPNTTYAFLKAMAEAVVLSRNDAATAKRAIARYTKVEDQKIVDETYDAFAPYWAMSLVVRPEPIEIWFRYLDEKDYPQIKSADPRAFYDNSFVDNLEKSGFFQKLGWVK